MATIGFTAREYLDFFQLLEAGGGTLDPTKCYVGLLRTGLTITSTAGVAELIAGELAPVNGYSRQVLGQRVTSVDATANTLTIPNHGRSLGQELCIFSDGGSVPGALATQTRYFVAGTLTQNTIQVAATSGGAAIDITSVGSGNIFIKMLGSFNATTLREENAYDEIIETASGGTLGYQGYFVLYNAAPTSSVVANAVNSSTNEVTTATAHNLLTGDPCMLTFDAGGSQPPGSVGTTIYFARAVSTTVATLHTTAAGAAANTGKVAVTGIGTGTIRLRHARGVVRGFDNTLTPTTLADTEQGVIRISNAYSNGGGQNGV